MEPGSLFVAFAGERVDGHDFAGAVVSGRGRRTGVPPRRPAARHRRRGRPERTRALARHVVRRLGATLVALTGSAGKTSTKDLIAQVLQRAAPTVWTPGSLNNEIGLPLTALSATEDTRFLVLDTGACGIGHIRYLAELTPPKIGLVLNVGSAHIGEFGGREQIAQAKGELVEYLPEDGTAVLNADDPLVLAMASAMKAKVILFGESGEADVRAEKRGRLNGQRTARLQASHTLRCKRSDHAPVR
ncbi:UDP-N-acetylmuramoyl-tripeptide--D-alanyl-D-alanine ligase OS=Streptomyces alboniger OX=132473 GN=murF PE=3 SV=1 [Streptomyces alboniger]